jgi:hypothetical protein
LAARLDTTLLLRPSAIAGRHDGRDREGCLRGEPICDQLPRRVRPGGSWAFGIETLDIDRAPALRAEGRGGRANGQSLLERTPPMVFARPPEEPPSEERYHVAGRSPGLRVNATVPAFPAPLGVKPRLAPVTHSETAARRSQLRGQRRTPPIQVPPASRLSPVAQTMKPGTGNLDTINKHHSARQVKPDIKRSLYPDDRPDRGSGHVRNLRQFAELRSQRFALSEVSGGRPHVDKAHMPNSRLSPHLRSPAKPGERANSGSGPADYPSQETQRR